MSKLIMLIALMALPLARAGAQHEGHEAPPAEAPAQHEHAQHGQHEQRTFAQKILEQADSGTSAQPNSAPSHMLMARRAGWMLMLHGNTFLVAQQQSGPRGGDKIFAPNWFMGMAQRPARPGTFTARVMISLDPATVTRRRYPLLFQEGEKAFGKPIVDGQHPHDFFMELAGMYDVRLGERGLLSFYGAPIGDPALGPTAYPHRTSAMENPLAALSHHQLDSTHIAADVLTLGLTYGIVRGEFSGFHGREPDENRWNIDQGEVDSWSTRVTLQPGQLWSGQFSYGRIRSPEAHAPNEDQERMTASLMHNRALNNGNWVSTLAWGRTRAIPDGTVFNSYLAESALRFGRNAVWTRLENVDRSKLLELGENVPPPGFHEHRVGRVQAYTFGYSRDVPVLPKVATAIGGQVTAYGVPANLHPSYGTRPVGLAIFLRLRPAGN